MLCHYFYHITCHVYISINYINITVKFIYVRMLITLLLSDVQLVFHLCNIQLPNLVQSQVLLYNISYSFSFAINCEFKKF